MSSQVTTSKTKTKQAQGDTSAYNALDSAFRIQPVGVPAAVLGWMNGALGSMVDNWETIAPLVGVPPEHTEALGDVLADRELMQSVHDAWMRRSGFAVSISPDTYYIRTLATGKYTATSELSDGMKYQMGMLKLQPAGTYVRDCGYRHGESIFYVMDPQK
jgi:hypothetical protein